MNEFLYTETHKIINVSKQRVRTNLVKGRCICHFSKVNKAQYLSVCLVCNIATYQVREGSL